MTYQQIPVVYFKGLLLFVFLSACTSEPQQAEAFQPKQQAKLTGILTVISNYHIDGKSCFVELAEQPGTYSIDMRDSSTLRTIGKSYRNGTPLYISLSGSRIIRARFPGRKAYLASLGQECNRYINDRSKASC